MNSEKEAALLWLREYASDLRERDGLHRVAAKFDEIIKTFSEQEDEERLRCTQCGFVIDTRFKAEFERRRDPFDVLSCYLKDEGIEWTKIASGKILINSPARRNGTFTQTQ